MGATIFKAVTSYRGERFQVPTRLTTVTRQTGEYKVDLTRHQKFTLAFGELASGRFPQCKRHMKRFSLEHFNIRKNLLSPPNNNSRDRQ